jgi:hypothetical protein
MTKPAKQLTPAQRAYLFVCRRAKSRRRAEAPGKMEDRFDDLDKAQHNATIEAVLAAGLDSDDYE